MKSSGNNNVIYSPPQLALMPANFKFWASGNNQPRFSRFISTIRLTPTNTADKYAVNLVASTGVNGKYCGLERISISCDFSGRVFLLSKNITAATPVTTGIIRNKETPAVSATDIINTVVTVNYANSGDGTFYNISGVIDQKIFNSRDNIIFDYTNSPFPCNTRNASQGSPDWYFFVVIVPDTPGTADAFITAEWFVV